MKSKFIYPYFSLFFPMLFCLFVLVCVWSILILQMLYLTKYLLFSLLYFCSYSHWL